MEESTLNTRLSTLPRRTWRRSFALALALALPAAAVSFLPTASANHPVLVEGELDFDGDGLIGPAEDTDNSTDRVFGTITAALGAANGGANQNGRVTIVTSGRFHEQINITNANGNTTVEAAPGVEANIDAVGTGDRATQFPSDNTTRQGQPGVVINVAGTNTHVTLRNLVIRNWIEGVRILNNSRVTLDNLRLEGNVNYGIVARNNSRLTLVNSFVTSTGLRVGNTGNFPAVNTPDPGVGIAVFDRATAALTGVVVSGSFGAGVSNQGNFYQPFMFMNVTAFDNNPNFLNVRPPRD
jgi:hypothetical protein